MKTDWTITGAGGQAVVEEGGSKRCQLTAIKQMLWNGRNNLVNSEIIGQIKFPQGSANAQAGFVLRSDLSQNNCYYCAILAYSPKQYVLYRIVAGVMTNIAVAFSTEAQTVYTKVRFRIDGNQISIEEYIAGVWNLIKVVTDTYITAGGYAGLRSVSNAGYYALYDNLEINERP